MKLIVYKSIGTLHDLDINQCKKNNTSQLAKKEIEGTSLF